MPHRTMSRRRLLGVSLGGAGTLKALIIPGAANAFGIFWMRQYAQNSLPDELLDAGRIDGAGFFRLYAQVALPLFRPANLKIAYNTDYAVVMAGALMSVLPLIVVFLIGARHFLRDLAAGRRRGERGWVGSRDGEERGRSGEGGLGSGA